MLVASVGSRAPCRSNSTIGEKSASRNVGRSGILARSGRIFAREFGGVGKQMGM